MVAVDPGDHLRLVRPAAQLPVRARHLDAAVGRLAAAAGEEEAVDGRVAESCEALGQLDGARVGAAGVPGYVGQLGGLLAHRVGQLRPAVPGRYVPEPGQAVDVLAPVRVGEDRPVALHPHTGVPLQRLFVERMDEVCDVAREKVGGGCHGKGVLTGRIARGRATLRDPHGEESAPPAGSVRSRCGGDRGGRRARGDWRRPDGGPGFDRIPGGHLRAGPRRITGRPVRFRRGHRGDRPAVRDDRLSDFEPLRAGGAPPLRGVRRHGPVLAGLRRRGAAGGRVAGAPLLVRLSVRGAAGRGPCARGAGRGQRDPGSRGVRPRSAPESTADGSTIGTSHSA